MAVDIDSIFRAISSARPKMATDPDTQSVAGTAVSQGISAALTGFSVGGGPVGAAVGGIIGLATGALTQAKANREANLAEQQERRNLNTMDRNMSARSYANFQYGDGWYKFGGPLDIPMRKIKGKGGQLVPINSNTYKVDGPSHEQGGVTFDGQELEGNETIFQTPEQDYVMSDYLKPNAQMTYAEQDTQFAKALGKLENKPKDQYVRTGIEMIQKRRMDNLRKQELHRQLFIDNLINNQTNA